MNIFDIVHLARDLGASDIHLTDNSNAVFRISGVLTEQDIFIDNLHALLSMIMDSKQEKMIEDKIDIDFAFADDIHDIEDLKRGMQLPGIVTNITNFGAFVDIGLHENGLIHVSQLGPRGTETGKVLKLHQHIKVVVKDVDLERKRIALALVPERTLS